MKKQILSIVLTLFMGITLVAAKELKPKKNHAVAHQEIVTLLTASPGAVEELENEVLVRVKIKINNKNEIVVLETNAPTQNLIDYITRNLNYKKMNSTELDIDSEYVFEINFKPNL
jgi:hypothetical protein